jgi:hypothetical protein
MRTTQTSIPLRHYPPGFLDRIHRAAVEACHSDGGSRHFEGQKHLWIAAGVSRPPAFDDVGGWSENARQKCQQKCQQNSTKVARGQILTIPPASLVNTSISVPNFRGEGRRFRPSPPNLTAMAARA